MTKAIIFDFFDVFRTDAYKSWLAANRIPHEGEYFAASNTLSSFIRALLAKHDLERLFILRNCNFK